METNKQTNDKSQHVSVFVTLWHSVSKIVEKTGIFKTILIAMLVVFFSMCGYLALNPQIIFSQFQHWQEQQHNAAVQKRMESNPIIDALLTKLLLETQAHRCFLIEFHDGKRNLSGLPFTFGRMTAQVTQDTIASSISEFDEFNLDQFKLTTQIINDGYWGGTSDDLMHIDAPLAHKILINGTHSIVMVTLYGSTSAIGVLGVSFTSETGYNEERIEGIVRRYSYQVASAIDADKL